MRIDVHNRKQAEVLDPRPNVWVISIYTPGDDPAALKEGWERVDRYCFSDIAGDCSEMLLWVDDLRKKGRGVILFDSDMAMDMYATLTAARHFNKDIVVHCDAGVSRSQAVARFARTYFDADVVSHTIGTDQSANGLVLRHLNAIVWTEKFEATKGSFTTHSDVNDE